MYYVIYDTVSGRFRRDFPGILQALRFTKQLEKAEGINTCLAYVLRYGRNVSCYQHQATRPATPQTQLAWN